MAGTKDKDPLDDWPYAFRTVEEDLNPSLIERHGLLHLYRALNIGNLVAFIGSGTSTAYGRLSWPEMVDQQRRLVTEIREKIKHEDGQKRDEIFSSIRSLEATFDSINNSKSQAAFPITFQIGEKLFETIAEQLSEGDKSDSESNEESIANYRDHARKLTYDDREFCINLLRVAELGHDPDKNGVADNIKKFNKKLNKYCPPETRPLSRSLPKRDDFGYYNYLNLFSADAFAESANHIQQHLGTDNCQWADTCTIIRDYFADCSSQTFVTPTHRFLIAALLSLNPVAIWPVLGKPANYHFRSERT